VSLESAKWETVVQELGGECFYFAGQLDRPAERSQLVPEAFYRHPEIDAINKVGSLGDLSQKQQFNYLKINDVFGAVDAALLKTEGAVLENKVKADNKVAAREGLVKIDAD